MCFDEFKTALKQGLQVFVKKSKVFLENRLTNAMKYDHIQILFIEDFKKK